MGNYILYPVSYGGLAYEMKRLVDDYQERKISLDVFIDTLGAWKENCDFMLTPEGDLIAGVARIVGKKRATVVKKALTTGAALVR